MDNLNEFFPYIRLTTVLVSTILAVVLVSSTRNLSGKRWLLAFVIISLVTWPGFQIIQIIAKHTANPRGVYQWLAVFNLISLFGTACFGLFLFSVWSSSRMRVDTGKLLFSFKGRIPRSAFWISACILFPLGTVIGFMSSASEGTGFPHVVIWGVYVCWILLSIWMSLAIYAKRWHDCSKSGWMTLVILIPAIGPIWLIVYLGFVRGTQGANRFGDDPLNISGGEAQGAPDES